MESNPIRYGNLSLAKKVDILKLLKRHNLKPDKIKFYVIIYTDFINKNDDVIEFELINS